jgi:hypothetical protein
VFEKLLQYSPTTVRSYIIFLSHTKVFTKDSIYVEQFSFLCNPVPIQGKYGI